MRETSSLLTAALCQTMFADFEAFDSEDTLSLLNRYVEEAEVDLDKSRIQKMIQDTYQEACELV